MPPPPKSPMRFKGGTGGESSLPIAAKAPDKAIQLISCPAAFANGPV